MFIIYNKFNSKILKDSGGKTIFISVHTYIYLKLLKLFENKNV